MIKQISLPALAVIMMFLMPSCVAKKKYLEMTDAKVSAETSLENARQNIRTLETEKSELETTLTREREELSGKISTLESEMSEKDMALNASTEELTMAKKDVEAKGAEATELRSRIDQAVSHVRSSGFDVSTRNGKIYINTIAPIDFRSGSARLDSESRGALDLVAERLIANPNLHILVEGHTDNAKMVNDANWHDNWALSYARARNVVAYLTKKGVNPIQVAAVGRSEYDPKSGSLEDRDREIRATNRRVELAIPVNADPLMSAR